MDRRTCLVTALVLILSIHWCSAYKDRSHGAVSFPPALLNQYQDSCLNVQSTQSAIDTLPWESTNRNDLFAIFAAVMCCSSLLHVLATSWSAMQSRHFTRNLTHVMKQTLFDHAASIDQAIRDSVDLSANKHETAVRESSQNVAELVENGFKDLHERLELIGKTSDHIGSSDDLNYKHAEDKKSVYCRDAGEVVPSCSDASQIASCDLLKIKPRRLQMLRSMPLVVDKHPVQPLKSEMPSIAEALRLAENILRDSRKCPAVILDEQPLTTTTVQRCTTSVIGHFSGHGSYIDGSGDSYIIAEHPDPNWCGLGCRLRPSDIRGMRFGGMKLAFLNVCQQEEFGKAFVKAGVEHVICWASTVGNSDSIIFLETFYLSLFKGETVARAVEDGRIALRSHPNRQTKCAETYLKLLPEDANHDVVLLPPVDCPPTSTDNILALRTSEGQVCGSRPDMTLEGIYGSETNIVCALQHLKNRRALQLYGCAGIGKSTLHQAVRHAFEVYQRGLCVDICVDSPSEAIDILMQLRNAVETALQRLQRCVGSGPEDLITTAQACSAESPEALRNVEVALGQLRHIWTGPLLISIDLDTCPNMIQNCGLQSCMKQLLQNRSLNIHLILSSQEQMWDKWAAFTSDKIPSMEVLGLSAEQAALLFMRSLKRQLRQEELFPDGSKAVATISSDTLRAIWEHPCFQADARWIGNPRRIKHLAEKASNVLSLWELEPQREPPAKPQALTLDTSFSREEPGHDVEW